MATETAKPAKKPRRRPPPTIPTWDTQKALQLASQGVNPTDIANVVGVHRTTVADYLKRATPEFEALPTFRDRLGDALALSVAKLSDLEDKLLTELCKEDISSLTISEKEKLLGRITIAKGINFDKLRLQEGKSTVNSSHRIQLESVHRTLYVDEDTPKQGSQVATTKGKTRAIMETDGVETTQPIDSIEITGDGT